MSLIEKAKLDRIRKLNDALRTSFDQKLGKIVMTSGVDALASDVKAMAIRRVATFSDFTADNDPHKEHDCGSFDLAGQKFFWKIDYYDSTLAFGSEDPSDPEQTTRVLTLMLAESCYSEFASFRLCITLPSAFQEPSARALTLRSPAWQ